MIEKTLQQELEIFLKHIKDVHTDKYGHLQICESGDDLDPTIKNVVKNYIKKK